MASTLRLAQYWLVALCCWHASHAATEYNSYLAHIFQKYGNGGTMSFEGLEHLMYSLGLGQIEFDPTHTIAEHRSPGFEGAHSASDQQIKRFIEEQTVHLLPSEDDDAAHSLEPESITNGGPAPGRAVAVSHDRSVTEKGFVLEFKEMHDPRHRHPRENDATPDSRPLAANVCLSPKSLLRLVIDHDDLHKRKLYRTFTASSVSGHTTTTTDSAHNPEEEYNEYVNSVKLTPVAFMKLCPALLAQIDQHVCVRPAPLLHEEDSNSQIINAWIYATVSIFVLSACGLLGILMVPLMRSVAYQEILSFLVAVAVGTLSGDALMHLLPHALVAEHSETAIASSGRSTSEHGHDNTAVWICSCAFATAIGMYLLENLLPLLKSDTANASGHGHGHSHNHTHTHRPSAAGQDTSGHGHTHPQQPTSLPPQPAPTIDARAAANGSATTSTIAVAIGTQSIEAHDINVMLDELKKDKKGTSRPLTPVAFMVVIGDGLHNLTDGLAIGAAFATDPVTGMATAFAVLCHELPHELGDFALLLQTGVSMRRAVCLNVVSSVLSFLGMAIGLLVAGLHSHMTQWIYAATAGSFLYIAFADLIPAMGAETVGGKRALKTICIQCCGIMVGGLIMLVIAVNEDALEKLFQ